VIKKLTAQQLDDINRWTSYGDELEERVRNGIAALDGNEVPSVRDYRLRCRECPRCWYLRGPSISGQAFTDYKCRLCEQTKSHENTSTPSYCPECCDKFALCGACGGTLDCKRRRMKGARK
jgi:hypothetical protein